MLFWEAQAAARRKTAFYLTAFLLLTCGVALLLEYAVRLLAEEGYTPPIPYLGLVYMGITLLVAGCYYLSYRSQGGGGVARSLGGIRVTGESNQPKERQLFHIVEEMALASGQPMPEIYLLEAREINAFAAGVRADRAAIAVTRGALDKLSRDELQGVIGHEFSHIAQGDMRINMRLAAMIMGFVFILYMGIRLLEGSLLFGGGRGRREGGGNNPIALIALLFVLAGLVTWFAGALLRSLVSRQREYLADASAVQYTRNPEGIAGALRKIAQDQSVHDMPKQGMAYSHLYFDNRSFWAQLFATHPPLKKRIAALESTFRAPHG